MSEKFIYLYQKVRPIVLKLRKSYQLRLWEQSDWEQEGMITLHGLLLKHPELKDSALLYPYFKTKFSNYIKDQLRKQESQKRRFDKLPYEEIGDIAHSLSSDEMLVADRVAYQAMLEYVQSQLSEEEQEKLERIMAGERFAGRATLVKKLKVLMSSYEQG